MTKPINETAGDAQMLDKSDLAKLFKISDRHVDNLRRDGYLPQPVKLGASVRWPRRVIDDWIAAGCPVASELTRESPQMRALPRPK